MVDLSDRQTQVRIAIVALAGIILMFFLGVPPFDSPNASDNPDNETMNVTNSTPPTEPVEGFPTGASEGGIAAETLLETHRETVENASSLTYYYEYNVNAEDRERTYRQTEAKLNLTMELYTFETQSTDTGIQQYRTPSESYQKPFLSDDVERISPTPAVPSTDGAAETNSFGASAFEERLTRENATFEYQGKTTYFDQDVHAYSASNEAINQPDNFTFTSAQMTVYVHPKGYIMGFGGEYAGYPEGRALTRPEVRYQYTELLYDVNETTPNKSDWVPS